MIAIPAAIEHLVGLQAQAAEPPYVGLWTRLEGFAFEDLSRLMIERRVVRSALMRGTLHIVAARDVQRLACDILANRWNVVWHRVPLSRWSWGKSA